MGVCFMDKNPNELKTPIPHSTSYQDPNLQPANTTRYAEPQTSHISRAPLDFNPEERARIRKLADEVPPDLSKVNIDLPLSCGLTRREIEQMKAAGIDQPSWIKTSEWLGPMKLSHRHQLIAHLAALGMRPREICAAANVSSQWLGVLLQQPAIKERIEVIRSVELRGLGIDKRLEMLAPRAVRTYEDLLEDPRVRDSVKGTVARDILDRRYGKPLQKVEMGGSLIRDLIALAKLEQKESKAIDVTSNTLYQEIPIMDVKEGAEIDQSAPIDEKKKIQQDVLERIDDWFADNFDAEK